GQLRPAARRVPGGDPRGRRRPHLRRGGPMSTLSPGALPISALPWLVAAWLFAVGLYGIVTSRHCVHLVGCLTVCQSATYVLLLGLGYVREAGPPVFYDHP